MSKYNSVPFCINKDSLYVKRIIIKDGVSKVYDISNSRKRKDILEGDYVGIYDIANEEIKEIAKVIKIYRRKKRRAIENIDVKIVWNNQDNTDRYEKKILVQPYHLVSGNYKFEDKKEKKFDPVKLDVWRYLYFEYCRKEIIFIENELNSHIDSDKIEKHLKNIKRYICDFEWKLPSGDCKIDELISKIILKTTDLLSSSSFFVFRWIREYETDEENKRVYAGAIYHSILSSIFENMKILLSEEKKESVDDIKLIDEKIDEQLKYIDDLHFSCSSNKRRLHQIEFIEKLNKKIKVIQEINPELEETKKIIENKNDFIDDYEYRIDWLLGLHNLENTIKESQQSLENFKESFLLKKIQWYENSTLKCEEFFEDDDLFFNDS